MQVEVEPTPPQGVFFFFLFLLFVHDLLILSIREKTSLFLVPPPEDVAPVELSPEALVVTAGTSPSVPALALLSCAAANSLPLALRLVSLAVRR